MAEYAVPPSDEPFDFRRQAASYARHRPDYSPALYAAIAARAGEGAGRRAIDLGCGTGFVSRALVARGWHVVGIDFSAPMLAEAHAAVGSRARFARARAEALPLGNAAGALLTCGTAFHWFAPAPALGEIARVLAPGGWAAIFWRYPAPGSPAMRMVADLLGRFGVTVPPPMYETSPFPPPFQGSGFDADPEVRLDSVVRFSPAELHGYLTTLEWVRRFAGERYQPVLDALAEEIAGRPAASFEEPMQERLFIARRP
jgi:SAM-dependent methyltransferase